MNRLSEYGKVMLIRTVLWLEDIFHSEKNSEQNVKQYMSDFMCREVKHMNTNGHVKIQSY